MVISPCSEYPNANPDLHDGALVGCADPCGPCTRLEAPAARTRAPGESGFFERRKAARAAPDLPRLGELEPFETEDERVAEGPPPADGFARVTNVLLRIAGTLAGDGPQRVQAALSGSAPLPPPIAYALLHWRALLEGEDSSSLPELTLDEWAAGLLAALFGASVVDLKSRVRSEGIAAFGVLEAA